MKRMTSSMKFFEVPTIWSIKPLLQSMYFFYFIFQTPVWMSYNQNEIRIRQMINKSFHFHWYSFLTFSYPCWCPFALDIKQGSWYLFPNSTLITIYVGLPACRYYHFTPIWLFIQWQKSILLFIQKWILKVYLALPCIIFTFIISSLYIFSCLSMDLVYCSLPLQRQW